MGVKIQFFPTDLHYKEVDGRPVIHLYGPTSDGTQICVTDANFEPYFYAVVKDSGMKLESVRIEKNGKVYKVTRTELVSKRFLGKDVTATKIYVNLPLGVPVIREELGKSESIGQMFEYDIQFVRRYLIDKNLTPFTLVEVDAEKVAARSKVPVFQASSVSQFSDDTLVRPKVLALDIETYNPLGKYVDTEKNPIIMLGFYGKDFQRVYTWKQYATTLPYVEFVKSEADLIEKFKEVVEAYKPDILVGYFSDSFDLPYIDARARKYKIRLDLGLDYTEMRIKRSRGLVLTRTSASMAGIIHLDLIDIIRKILGRGMDVEYYRLDAVASELLGEKKMKIDLGSLAEAWDKGQRLDEFCSYNLHDARLAHMLCEKVLPHLLEMTKIVGLSVVDVSKMGFSQLVEWYLLKQAPNFNELAPNRPDHDVARQRRMNTFKGAFVYEPKPGLYTDIVLFDFRSLYPTIISSHNISPETLNCDCCWDEGKFVPREQSDESERWFCSKRKGFIPTILEDLITRRMRIKEIMKERGNHALLHARQETLKLLANSFYGYLGFFAARWYSIECAKSVTAYGRFYIQKVIDSAKQDGFSVLYSDTDSIFVLLEKHSREDTTKFAEKLNMQLPALMELEYEGFYPAGLFVSIKAGEMGAKKKYALLDENGEVKIKGFETVRRNWSFIAKDVQKDVIGSILRNKDSGEALTYVKEVIRQLRQNLVPLDKVIIYTQLQKVVEEYNSVGPHVRAAMRMKNRGIAVGPGSLIKFVVVKGTGRVGDRVRLADEAAQGDYDASYYIYNQIIPSVDRIFAVLGIGQKEILESREQKKLAGFFV
jgi:DNA polymerase elongation subunit (family B)